MSTRIRRCLFDVVAAAVEARLDPAHGEEARIRPSLVVVQQDGQVVQEGGVHLAVFEGVSSKMAQRSSFSWHLCAKP